MNPYDTSTITVKKYATKGDRIYGELRSSGGELLVSASLEYIVKILEERMTKSQEKGMQFEGVTDEQMVGIYKKQASSMSFYNASEGQSWYAEATARAACGAEFRKIKEEFVARGLDVPNGSWLI